MQRLQDAKFFTGWIEDFYGNRVTISSNNQHVVEAGQDFRIEGYGHHISVVFQAKLSQHGVFDPSTHGLVLPTERSGARVAEATRCSMELLVTSQIRFSASQESVRMKIPEVYTVIKDAYLKMEGVTVDVAPMGCGIVTRSPLTPNTMVEILLETKLGPVTGLANVRYCTSDRDRGGMFRSGVMFTDLGRVERLRWERFLRELS